MRILLVFIAAVAVAVSMGACGKKSKNNAPVVDRGGTRDIIDSGQVGSEGENQTPDYKPMPLPGQERVLPGPGPGSDSRGEFRVGDEELGGGVVGTYDFGDSRPSTDHYFDHPIITRARTPNLLLYTDAANDDIMYHLVGLMDQMPEPLREDSINLALRVRDVQVQANMRTHEIENVLIRVDDGMGRDAELRFLNGPMDQDRRAFLQLDSARSQTLGAEFVASALCMDQDSNSCENLIITLDQIKDGVVCKRIFIVYRHGDARIEISQNDYLNYTSSLNVNHKRFLEYLANSVTYFRHLTQGTIIAEPLMPRAKSIGMRSWAAAYGIGWFSLEFVSAMHADAAPQEDSLGFYGFLVSSVAGPEVSRDVEFWAQEFVWSNLNNQDRQFSNMILSATLDANDGRGNFGIQMKFRGAPTMTATMQARTRVRPTLSLESRLHLLEPRPMYPDPRPERPIIEREMPVK